MLRIHRQLTRCVLFLGLGLLIVACTSVEDATVELTETTSGDVAGGTVTIDYPEGWSTSVEDDVLLFGTREELIADELAARRSGDAAGGVAVVMPEALFIYDVEPDDSITFITRAVAGQFAPDQQNLVLGEPSSFNAGQGRQGAIVTGTATGSNNGFGRIAIAVVDEGDAFGVITLATFGDELLISDLVRSMGRTFEYAP